MDIRFPAFDQVRALVIGDLMLDRYWSGQVNRISPEAPVPVVNIKAVTESPGGAGNVAMNLASLGAHVTLMGALGQDHAAEIFLAKLKEARIDTSAIEQSPHHSTICKTRVLSHHQQLIRLDSEERFHFSGLDVSMLMDRFTEQLPQYNVVVISDYEKGTLQDPQRLIQAANQHQIPILVDPKGSDFTKYRNAYCLTPNRREFEQVFGVCQNDAQLEQKGLEALHFLGLHALLITRGEEGMSLFRAQEAPLHLSAKAYEVKDVTGAGDTVIAVLAGAIAAGEQITHGVVLANIAAGLIVTRLGTEAVTEHALRQTIHKQHFQLGLLTEDEAVLARNRARLCQETVVMTNGCFDLLHSGHIGYLEDAKALGDRLLVAVNDDDCVRRSKGPGRPFQNLSERMSVLAGLRSVDWVVPFSEDTPLRLIEKLSPDKLVKGVDYEGQNIVGADFVLASGGEVHYVGPPKQNSSSQLVKKVQACIDS